ncbi:MAG: aminotransferase class V-fold PLP-dependent enzyme [Acidobacteriaceae bacterium]|nr:aminotransferase class V-fold PLP-dependent enzyme [Acidobacteriaceae bacterium]MBV9782066.1 aminotransferase class V-fold PLP-dependent enzyme [Acidobacteriaceae bacterium]
MALNRREILQGIGGLAAARNLLATSDRAPALPAKSDFAIPPGITYLNSAYTHPMPLAARESLREWAEFRSHPEAVSQPEELIDIKAEFAALINAKPSEICYLPNTSTGENLVVNGLDIDYKSDNVVTDALHFEGAILHLQALQQRFGLDLRMVMPETGASS